MACTFDIEVSGSPTEIVEKAKKMITDAGGSVSGDSMQGDYKLKLPIGGVEGGYAVSGSSIRFEIRKKPMLVPCSTVESYLKGRIQNG